MSKSSKKRKQMSHAEIWDDSALVDSWNEALAEFQYYHSIHARGEKVEDVLRKAEEDDDAQSRAFRGKHGLDGGAGEMVMGDAVDEGDADEDVEEGEWEGDDVQAEEVDEGKTARVSDSISHENGKTSEGAGAIVPPSVGVPGMVLGGQDQAMKNLMMSWYHAGYYTGFYEGQQSIAQNQGEKGDSVRSGNGRAV